MDQRTLRQLAHEALAVQDACNSVAVANGYARALSRLRAIVGGETEARGHAINRLWLSKLADLAGQCVIVRLGDWQTCEDLAGVVANYSPTAARQ